MNHYVTLIDRSYLPSSLSGLCRHTTLTDTKEGYVPIRFRDIPLELTTVIPDHAG